jgi:hypothetical protein
MLMNVIRWPQPGVVASMAVVVTVVFVGAAARPSSAKSLTLVASRIATEAYVSPQGDRIVYSSLPGVTTVRDAGGGDTRDFSTPGCDAIAIASSGVLLQCPAPALLDTATGQARYFPAGNPPYWQDGWKTFDQFSELGNFWAVGMRRVGPGPVYEQQQVYLNLHTGRVETDNRIRDLDDSSVVAGNSSPCRDYHGARAFSLIFRGSQLRVLNCANHKTTTLTRCGRGCRGAGLPAHGRVAWFTHGGRRLHVRRVRGNLHSCSWAVPVLGGTVPPRVLIARHQLFVNVDLAENGGATALYSADLKRC